MMKICKVIFGLAVAAMAFVSFQASADTQVNCSWQYVNTITAYPYGSVSTLNSYNCVDAQNRTIANRVIGMTGYLSGYCSVNVTDSNKFYYTGTCQQPVFWEKPVVAKVCPADGIVRTVSTSSDVNAAMKWTCYLEQPECGARVTSSNQSNVTFQCYTK